MKSTMSRKGSSQRRNHESGWRRGLHSRLRPPEAGHFLETLLASELGTTPSMTLITDILAEQLHLESAALWLEHGVSKSGAIHLVRAVDGSTPDERVQKPAGWIGGQPRNGAEARHRLPDEIMLERSAWDDLEGKCAFILHPSCAPLPKVLRPFRVGKRIEVLTPLTFGGHPKGLLALGRRQNGETFRPRDLDMLAQIGHQVTLFLEMIRQSQQVIYTHNRLHDTTQHFLVRMEYKVKALLRTEETMSPATVRTLRQWTTEFFEQGQIVKDIRMGKYQKSVRDIPMMFWNTRQRDGLDIHDEVILSPSLPPELQDELYHWVRESLNNILKYADAKRVIVRLRQEEAHIELYVQDDGCGFTTDEHAATIGSTGGLQRIRQQVITYGGTFRMLSAPGIGTTLHLMIPVPEEG